MEQVKDRTGHAVPGRRGGSRVTLKTVADRLGLSTATVSIVLNSAPAAAGIPGPTKERIFAAARELGYRPNLLARSLRRQRSFLLGVLVPEMSEGYASGVMTGVMGGLEQRLTEQGYSFLIAHHHSRTDVLETRLRQLQDLCAEGLVLIGTRLKAAPSLPAVAVSGHQRFPGLTNVVVDHDRAARLALGHLTDLGHRRIAFFQGAEGNVDAEDRWRAIVEAAREFDLEIRPELAPRLAGRSYGPVESQDGGYQEGYTYGQKLLARSSRPRFTAVYAFNDFSAIGAIRAFLDAGLRVPEDVSVIGFDDIFGAAFQNPTLTTIRQPMAEMGATAGKILMERLAGEEPHSDCVRVEPELVIRDSTGPVPLPDNSDVLIV